MLAKLMDGLAYSFKDPALLKTALTHRSMKISGLDHHNERLEFLGDAVLSLCIGTALFQRFPSANEGQLSRMKAELVRGEALVAVAQSIGLGDSILLGQGERKTGGQWRASILEDAMEALIGALYCDGGLAAAEAFILEYWGEKLASFKTDTQKIDAKTELQEYLQHERQEKPEYLLRRTEGLAHEQIFFVACEVKSMEISAEGKARSRKAAEQVAAAAVLEQLRAKRKKADMNRPFLT